MSRSWWTHCFAYIIENFNPDLAKILPSYVNSACAVYTISNVLFHIYFSNWRYYTIIFTGIPFLAIGILQFLFLLKSGFKPKEEVIKSFKSFKNYVISETNII